jgi:hypothetical protein
MAKKRMCKYCEKWTDDFIKTNVAVFCDVDCAYKFARAKQEKEQARLITKLKQVGVKADKVAKKAHREAKERIKPKSKWLAELQAVFNKYVRLRDLKFGCVSCNKPSDWHGQFHAGHYFSRGHSSSLRFNLWNCHKQCSVCNNHLSGNIGEYTPGLIRRIGKERFDYLVAHKSEIASYDVDWIKRAIKITRKAIKRLELRGL